MEKTTRKGRGSQGNPPSHVSGQKQRKGVKTSNFIVQGSILAAAGIIVRLIGMLYRIPLANKIGDDGNGYYNAAYSIYSILLIMSSYSLPVAVSKMVAVRLAKKQYRNSIRIFKAAMFYATIAGALGFLALWFGADYFAVVVIKMPYSAYALKALAPTIWIMAYLGVLRGYFQGHSTMIPTAFSQIFEQIINAVISILAAVSLYDIGFKSNLVYDSTEYAFAFGAAGGAIGTGAGALAALFFCLLLLMGYRPIIKRQVRKDQSGRVERYSAISGTLFFTIAPIIMSSVIYNIITVVDNSIFGNVMTDLGEGKRIASDWGIMGKYHLLFNIPVAIANSLSSSLIPSLSQAAAGRNRKQVVSKISSAIRFSMIIAIPSAVGLTVLAHPISNLLFSGVDNTMLTKMTMVGSAAVVFFSLSTVSNAVLQGINRMRIPIRNSTIALIIHVGILYVLLYGVKMGIYGVVYANILFALTVCILNGMSIRRCLRYRQDVKKTFLIPTAAAGVMGMAAYGIYQLIFKMVGTTLEGRLATSVCLMPAIVAAVLVYFVLLIKLGGVGRDEMRGMPGGTRLIGLAKRLHLM